MPRISLYKPEKGPDYDFMDKVIEEQFTIGGTDLFIHKYLGPESPTDENASATQPQFDKVGLENIQDLLFLENRDRKYDEHIYRLRGVYQVQDNDFNLSQFGMFLDNDTIFVNVHINNSVDTVGRKIVIGDVVELPHLRDEHALNDAQTALKRFYVVDDVTRASQGFSQTWYPHLYRLKLKQMFDSQEYKDVLDNAIDEDEPGSDSLRSLLSNYQAEADVNHGVLQQAEVDADQSGYDVAHFYRIQNFDSNRDESIKIRPEIDRDVAVPAPKGGFDGYLIGDEFGVNGANFGKGIEFPSNPENGDFFLRTDFLPNRMFKFFEGKWLKVFDNVRMTMTNSGERQTQATSFVNEKRYTYNELVEYDVVNLEKGDFEIETDIDYPVNARFLVLKYSVEEKDYELEDFPDLIQSGSDSKILIKLPIIQGEQDIIDYSGQWEVKFYNNREPVRQSLNDLLRPKADN